MQLTCYCTTDVFAFCEACHNNIKTEHEYVEEKEVDSKRRQGIIRRKVNGISREEREMNQLPQSNEISLYNIDQIRKLTNGISLV